MTMTEIITFGNYKGGVGKTSITKLTAYILSQLEDRKVLAIDLDGQENLSDGLAKTFKKKLDSSKNIFDGIFGYANGEFKPEEFIHELDDNLHLLAGSEQMSYFEDELKNYKKEYHQEMLLMFLEPIIAQYDYVLIDTSPMVNIVTDNVMKVTNWVVIPTQTASDALEGSQKFYNYLATLYETAEYPFEFLGVLSYLVGESSTNKKYIGKYKEIFEEDTFEKIIKRSSVVERWADQGITQDLPYDKRTMKMYQEVTKEIIGRIEAQKTIG